MTYRALTTQIERKCGPEFRSGRERSGWVKLEGRKILRVTIPKIHPGELPQGTANKIRQNLKLTNGQFEGLYDCPFSAADFQAHLRRIAAQPGPES